MPKVNPLHVTIEEPSFLDGMSFDISAVSEPATPPASPPPTTPTDDSRSPVSPSFSPISEVGSPLTSHPLLHSPAVHPPQASTPVQPQVSPLVHSDMQTQQQSPLTTTTAPSQWVGFKITGDNIDKNVRPRHQTLQRRTNSLHYFHSYAVMDRVDLSNVSDEHPTVDVLSIGMETILPSSDDYQKLLSNLATLVGRVLKKYIPALSKMNHLVVEHIPHLRSKEMAARSKVVGIACTFIYALIVVTCHAIHYRCHWEC